MGNWIGEVIILLRGQKTHHTVRNLVAWQGTCRFRAAGPKTWRQRGDEKASSLVDLRLITEFAFICSVAGRVRTAPKGRSFNGYFLERINHGSSA
jgi:hypothetical protein